jgi:hypothetical protein
VLIRSDDRGVLLIGQPSHAWISGQLARAWGNARFGAVEPFEEVCLGAEQHDIGMANSDLAPTLNPATGLPHSFLEMALATHLQLWRAGPRQLLSQSRYAALLASIHGTRLYEMRDLSAAPRTHADAIRLFLAEQRDFQADLRASLDIDPDLLKRNSQLVWTWDYVSLAVCLDWAPATAAEVPTADGGATDLELRPSERPRTLVVDPWPFTAEAVTLRCEGRRLTERFESDDALAQAVESAPWETLEFELVQAVS